MRNHLTWGFFYHLSLPDDINEIRAVLIFQINKKIHTCTYILLIYCYIKMLNDFVVYFIRKHIYIIFYKCFLSKSDGSLKMSLCSRLGISWMTEQKRKRPQNWTYLYMTQKETKKPRNTGESWSVLFTLFVIEICTYKFIALNIYSCRGSNNDEFPKVVNLYS